MRIDHIYVYHEDMGVQRQNELVPFWKEVWKRNGWHPEVVSRGEARQHPAYDQMVAKAKELPTRNDAKYEEACYLRWCAFATLPGRFAVSDYDVFPMASFLPLEGEPGLSNYEAGGGPGLITGNGADINRIVNAILKYTPTSEVHVSDMTILHRNKHLFSSIRSQIAYPGATGWRQMPLIHFGNSYVKNDQSKVRQIQEILCSSSKT